MQAQAKLIVLEGIDGCGKSTQFDLLWKRLEAEGKDLRRIVFPRYQEESSALVRQYLRGDFGTDPNAVNAYAASTFYAVDRYAAFKSDWGADYRGGKLILSDRYTTSNACHQGAKLPPEQRKAYLEWLYDFEFRLLELPKPDLVLYLDVDLEVSRRQMEKRQRQSNTKADIHEKDFHYLRDCQEAGRYAAAYYGWQTVHCMNPDGEMRSVAEIHEMIYHYVQEVL